MPSVEPLPAFSDNYIWLLRHGDSAFVVDPGDAEPVRRRLAELGVDLRGILLTHHHFDHVGGVDALKSAYECTVYGPDNPRIDGIDVMVGDGDRVAIDGFSFEVLAVPGHTLDHIAYFAGASGQEPPRLFCGDTLFAGGCGRIFEGDAPMMHRSLQRLAALPAQTRVYCAHEYTLANLAFARAAEPDNEALAERERRSQALRDDGQPTLPSTIALERETNPFLRSAEPALHAQLVRAGRTPDASSPSAVFAALRAWKDSF
jgi:hydroxyacylglutathione hydrolase